jgi:hypothetical protein
MNTDGDDCATIEQPTYIIRTVEIEKGIYYEDSNGKERWLAMRLRADMGTGTSVPFVSTTLERLIDENIESTVKRTAGHTQQKTLGEILNSLQWFHSKKNPRMELTSQDCETYRLLVDNIHKNGELNIEGYHYFILKDGKAVGRVPTQ